LRQSLLVQESKEQRGASGMASRRCSP